jgi:hypothetical protein
MDLNISLKKNKMKKEVDKLVDNLKSKLLRNSILKGKKRKFLIQKLKNKILLTPLNLKK